MQKLTKTERNWYTREKRKGPKRPLQRVTRPSIKTYEKGRVMFNVVST
jgi:hypothetical protein